MSLSCSADGDYDYMVEFPEHLSVSPGTLICPECKKLIYPGTPHYLVEHSRQADMDHPYLWEGDDIVVATREVCEECGDLAQSWLELGYCWTIGDLRSDIAELREIEKPGGWNWRW